MRLSLVFLLLPLFGISLVYAVHGARADASIITGSVLGNDGPVPGAHVRVRATENLVFSGNQGEFSLGGLTDGEEIEITAWSEGYYVASTLVTPPASNVQLILRRYHTSDNAAYTWTSPEAGTSEKACGNCHPAILPQWEGNAHSGAISNPRFYSLYNGTDTSGTLTVLPGYLDDFPGTAGSCASCHAPGAAVDGYLTTNMNDVRGDLTAGIHCDYCHKVGGVFQDLASGSLYPNSPGVVSQQILRPPEGDDIFFGPYDDIPDPDTYLPLFSESLYCAPCHQFSFWGTPIYESFNEWLESPYAQAGITCQACHMPPTGDTHFVPPESGGLPHPPESIPSHLQLGAASQDLLQNTVEMAADIRQVGGRIIVGVEITNTQAGHHVPTDHPGRHLLLSIKLEDEYGLPPAQLTGSSIAGWGGDLAGEPGKTYAKLLRDVESGDFPVISYWKRTQLVSDNRIPAGESDLSVFSFAVPPAGESVEITVTLRFRRLFMGEMQSRGWDTPDVIMEESTATITVEPWQEVYLPITITR